MSAVEQSSHDPARPGSTLTDRDLDMLSMERLWWQFAGAKEQAIREKFDMSATRYYQLLNALIDSDDALAFDPLLVKRLRRLRAQRQRSRSARRLGIDL
ncbi:MULTISPECIES: DUF3263 domain-containing protein [unclassified Aeromicrobium]|jgi:hypothetical protein|uniref:DUF3263 domain-containing protein n=1 Tax=unclassified Aeromicrobium TaxID=2633570 RepID=UPI0006F84B6F|nr:MULTISPECIES: DUF3263 domain-containing protein [unclassified Aeromicrobium]RYY46912.1 MAG: DUF3263 domain-containing protein [Actinomycetales bacterium]KQO36252.1 hypothetical protein ASF05_08645 [Aeromicrobium sp. Leaf245]KQP27735.1 hypothetical protein ASF38_02485 [Aeromicrobium sp. Leaf272]KQP78528.1 hypothetical protein ASF37_08210 [Aeromicrobium sp. Leaf289]KQP84237.1 hypothetical protein ASF35_04710 [Aeromicrobium sp. Leaf291]